MTTQPRISQESAKLISSLNPDFRYIFFKQLGDAFYAVICSQITDEELSSINSGNVELWLFEDKNKAIRSIRRLNKDIEIYTGSYEIELNKIQGCENV